MAIPWITSLKFIFRIISIASVSCKIFKRVCPQCWFFHTVTWFEPNDDTWARNGLINIFIEGAGLHLFSLFFFKKMWSVLATNLLTKFCNAVLWVTHCQLMVEKWPYFHHVVPPYPTHPISTCSAHLSQYLCWAWLTILWQDCKHL